MRSSLLVLLALCLAALVGAGCAAAGGPGKRTCTPILSWAAPAYRCAAPAAPEPEPVVEEEKPEPEPEEEEPVEEEPEERVSVKEEAIELAERVQFHSGSADLLPESEKLLSEVADALKEHPEVLRVRVEGHTDSRAGSRFNRKLSRARARAVRKFLMEQGISGRRLVARGYGEKDPIESNKSPEGRYKNRRVEFKILKRK